MKSFQSAGGPVLACHEHLPGQTSGRPRGHRVTCVYSEICRLAQGPDVETESTDRSSFQGSASSCELKVWEVQGSGREVVSMTAKDSALVAEELACESGPATQ